MPRDYLRIIESKSKVRHSPRKAIVSKVGTSSSTPGISPDVAELKDMVKALLLDKKKLNPKGFPLTLKASRESCIAITTRSGVSYNGTQVPPLPSSLPKEVEHEIEVTKDTVPPPNNGNLHFDISFADALILMPKFASTLKSLISNKEKLFELARTPLNEHCLAVLLKKLPKKLRDPGKFLIPCDFPGMDECLALADLGASINLMPLSVWKKLSLPELTPTCMTLELADRSISRPIGIAENVYVKVGKINLSYLGKEAVNIHLSQTSRNSSNYDDNSVNRIDVIDMACEEYSQEVLGFSDVIASKNDKSLIDEPPEVELKDLPPHLEYAFLEGDDKLPVIIAKDLSVEEKAALIKVLKSHKRAIAWKLSDIKGINPEFYTHKILMEEDYKLEVQHQRRVNSKIHDVIKKEVLKILDAGLIYPISNSPWVSHVHCVPKKGGFTVVENDENELIPTRLVTGWRVCIDYRKLNEATRKDHFPLPFMDQMLERLAGNEYYYFLDGFSGYFQISIDRQDQEKTTFTCPYGTFAYRRMPFGLCTLTGPVSHWCMMANFSHDMIKINDGKSLWTNFLGFGNSIRNCPLPFGNPRCLKGRVKTLIFV
ncbi:reverse transcriptase domain-containing protein [Tanacetum coccineum]